MEFGMKDTQESDKVNGPQSIDNATHVPQAAPVSFEQGLRTSNADSELEASRRRVEESIERVWRASHSLSKRKWNNESRISVEFEEKLHSFRTRLRAKLQKDLEEGLEQTRAVEAALKQVLMAIDFERILAHEEHSKASNKDGSHSLDISTKPMSNLRQTTAQEDNGDDVVVLIGDGVRDKNEDLKEPEA